MKGTTVRSCFLVQVRVCYERPVTRSLPLILPIRCSHGCQNLPVLPSRRTPPAPNASHAIISSTAHLPARSPFEPRTTDSEVGLEMGANTRAVLRLFTHHLLVSTTRARLVNKTIDDTYGDPITGRAPVYLPNGCWNSQNCFGCVINPNASLPFDGTWSAATYHSGQNDLDITFSFTG